MAQSFFKSVCTFFIFLIKCVLLTLVYIVIFAIISEIISYSKDVQTNVFLHIHKSLCDFWIEEFSFHFSYITTFFIFYMRIHKEIFKIR